jgi:hypothetical protein
VWWWRSPSPSCRWSASRECTALYRRGTCEHECSAAAGAGQRHACLLPEAVLPASTQPKPQPNNA